MQLNGMIKSEKKKSVCFHLPNILSKAKSGGCKRPSFASVKEKNRSKSKKTDVKGCVVIWSVQYQQILYSPNPKECTTTRVDSKMRHRPQAHQFQQKCHCGAKIFSGIQCPCVGQVADVMHSAFYVFLWIGTCSKNVLFIKSTFSLVACFSSSFEGRLSTKIMKTL